jgi:hypothetical protein
MLTSLLQFIDLRSPSEELALRDAAAPTLPAILAPATSSKRDAIDSVNLNVDGDTGVTLTFVEETDDE